jgi:hypothetical protein
MKRTLKKIRDTILKEASTRRTEAGVMLMKGK